MLVKKTFSCSNSPWSYSSLKLVSPPDHPIFDYKKSYHETNLTSLPAKIVTVFLCILFAVSDLALPQHRVTKFCPCPVPVALCCSNPSVFYHVEKLRFNIKLSISTFLLAPRLSQLCQYCKTKHQGFSDRFCQGFVCKNVSHPTLRF